MKVSNQNKKLHLEVSEDEYDVILGILNEVLLGQWQVSDEDWNENIGIERTIAESMLDDFPANRG